MRGQHQIDFDFEFDYAAKGDFASASSIVVQAPGLKDYRIHSWVSSVVNEALVNFAMRNPHLREQIKEQEQDDTKQEAGQDDTEQDALMILSAGMGDKDYPDFVEKLRKTITNAPHLAYLVAEGNPPITDKVWESLAKNGGLPACDKVVSGFVGLFFNERLAAAPPKKNGKRSRRAS